MEFDKAELEGDEIRIPPNIPSLVTNGSYSKQTHKQKVLESQIQGRIMDPVQVPNIRTDCLKRTRKRSSQRLSIGLASKDRIKRSTNV